MSSSDSDCSEESSCYLTANSGDSEPEFSPFDDTIEPLASAEEIAQYEDSIAREEELENTLQGLFIEHSFCISFRIYLLLSLIRLSANKVLISHQI